MAFMQHMIEAQPTQESPLSRQVRDHLGADPTTMSVIGLTMAAHDHPNLQRALDAWGSAAGHSVQLLGVAIQNRRFNGIELTEIIRTVRTGLAGGPTLDVGPVDYVTCSTSATDTLSCINNGLLLLTADGVPLVAAISGPNEQGPSQDLTVEVMSADQRASEAFTTEIATLARQLDVHRGKVLSLGSRHGPYQRGRTAFVEFMAPAAVSREDVILPGDTLALIEQQTVGFSDRSAALLAAGQELKRGVLLYGPPGTGKTHTLSYLMGQMPDRTTIVLSGMSFGLIAPAAEMARALAPSMLVMEDVDLVAQERGMGPMGTQPLLFELLNEMDGIGSDADVIFALTTNRADLLEPALAARPGRIDLAVEIPLPDADGRRRLMDTYGGRFELGRDVIERVVDRTDGVTASFIRELCRRAVLYAAVPGQTAVTVTPAHLDSALDHLLERAGQLQEERDTRRQQ